MSEVTLRYEAPVYVTVDTESGEVLSVVVSDESVEAAEDENGRQPYMVDGDDDHYQAAVKIAEGDTEWPAWTFGP